MVVLQNLNVVVLPNFTIDIKRNRANIMSKDYLSKNLVKLAGDSFDGSRVKEQLSPDSFSFLEDRVVPAFKKDPWGTSAAGVEAAANTVGVIGGTALLGTAPAMVANAFKPPVQRDTFKYLQTDPTLVGAKAKLKALLTNIGNNKRNIIKDTLHHYRRLPGMENPKLRRANAGIAGVIAALSAGRYFMDKALDKNTND